MVEIKKSDLIAAAKTAEQKIKDAIKEATQAFPNNQNEIAFIVDKEPLGELKVKFMVDIGRIKLID